jgi:uncharacterized membrane protein
MTTKTIDENKIDNHESKKDKFKNYLMSTLNGMTLGLFATLIIGTIFQQIGLLIINVNS